MNSINANNSNMTEFVNLEDFDLLNENYRENELKIAFELFDKNNDGLLDINELGNVMNSLGWEYNITELEDMIYEVCKESEKTLNFEKFMTIMNKRSSEVDTLEEYTEAFRIFDREGIGRINIEEMKEILISLGDGITIDQIETIFKEADIYSDGYIEYRKFVRLMLFK